MSLLSWIFGPRNTCALKIRDHKGYVCFCDEERDRALGIHRASWLDDGLGGYLCICGGGRYSAKRGCMTPNTDVS